MPRSMRLLAAAIGAVLVLSPVSTAQAEQAGQAGHVDQAGQVEHAEQVSTMRTVEVGCYEFNEVARVPVANLRAVVPDRYTVRASALDPTVGFILFVDYACDSLGVNGFTWPNRTVVTMGLGVLSARNGVPGTTYYILWYATNNPHLANALRRLGVPSHTILATDEIIAIDATHSRIHMRYHGARVDHERDAEVVEPPSGPISPSLSGRFYHLGEHGELLLSYVNRARPAGSARTELRIDGDSYLAALGVPTTLVSTVPFTRGEWDGTATIQ